MITAAIAKEKSLKIIDAIKDGMSENDAVILADLSADDYEDIRKRFPRVATIIDKAKIEYKRDIISKMSSAAKAGDMKAIQWIAENASAFNQDFGSKKKGGGQPTPDPLSEAFKFVQQNSKSPVPSKIVKI